MWPSEQVRNPVQNSMQSWRICRQTQLPRYFHIWPGFFIFLRRSWPPTRRRPTGTSGWRSYFRNTAARRSSLSCMESTIISKQKQKLCVNISPTNQPQDIANAEAWTHFGASLSHLVNNQAYLKFLLQTLSLKLYNIRYSIISKARPDDGEPSPHPAGQRQPGQRPHLLQLRWAGNFVTLETIEY